MREVIEKVIEEAKALCYESTSMALDLICETLYFQHKLDATFAGRSIYIGDTRVASIKTCIEPSDCGKVVGIYDYKIIIRG